MHMRDPVQSANLYLPDQLRAMDLHLPNHVRAGDLLADLRRDVHVQHLLDKLRRQHV
jgi:hypothetical protein